MQVAPTIELNDGHRLPGLGFGVWQVPDDDAQRAVATALDVGYRHIDTASIYGNESGVGRAVAAHGYREQVTIATKLWNADQGYHSTVQAAKDSRSRLGVDVIDLYLIHWCLPKVGRYLDTWRAFIDLREQGGRPLDRRLQLSRTSTG